MDEESNTPAPEIDPRHDDETHYRSDPTLIVGSIGAAAGVANAALYAYNPFRGEGAESEPPPQDSWASGPVFPPAVDAERPRYGGSS